MGNSRMSVTYRNGLYSTYLLNQRQDGWGFGQTVSARTMSGLRWKAFRELRRMKRAAGTA